MPALLNARHERFAQEIAKGVGAAEAYVTAGFKPNAGNARTLRNNQAVRKRVQAILEEREHIHAKAVERAIERTGITVGRVLGELAKIGFSDIRKAVRWKSARITEEDNPEGGDVLVIRNVVTNLVEIVGSDEIDDETASAIAEISQNATGGVRIKLHDKRAALVDIGRHLGMFPNKVELGGDANNPIRVETVNEDAREYVLGELARLASRRRQIEDHRTTDE
jgi:phage terminase small subunit